VPTVYRQSNGPEHDAPETGILDVLHNLLFALGNRHRTCTRSGVRAEGLAVFYIIPVSEPMLAVRGPVPGLCRTETELGRETPRRCVEVITRAHFARGKGARVGI
jgi:hypothetical protein